MLSSFMLYNGLGSCLNLFSTQLVTRRPMSTCKSPRLHHHSDLIALDFDGVVCASANESSITAMLTAKQLWPPYIPQEGSIAFVNITSALTSLRPIVETGYEIVLLSRLLSDMYTMSGILNVREVQMSWSVLYRDSLVIQYETSKELLVDKFGSMRDLIIQRNPNYWVNLNPFYPIVRSALADVSSNDKMFIITTKQERFVRQLLQYNQLLHLCRGVCGGNSAHSILKPDKAEKLNSNIFDLQSSYGSKAAVLMELARRQEKQHLSLPDTDCFPTTTIHFIEDRYETLLSVLEQRSMLASCATKQVDNKLSDVRLYLADWGYNTAEQRAAAQSNPDITVIDQEKLAELIKEAAKPVST